MQGANLSAANPMLAGQAAAASGQQMVGVRLPNGQVIVMQAQQAYALAAQQQQQLAALQQQQQQLLGGIRPAGQAVAGLQQPNAPHSAAVAAIQQRIAQSGQGAAASVAVRPAAQQQQLQQQQQQLLLALQQQQAAKQQAAQTPEPPQMGFTQEQLVVLREQIMLFKAVKKGTEPVTQEALQRCKPPPLPPPPPRPATVAPAGVSAAVPGLAGAVKPIAPVIATSAAANPAALAALQQQLQRQQQQPAALAQQALQQRNLAAAAQQRALAPAAAAAAGRPAQQPAGAAAAAAGQPEAPTGPTTPPMEVPVRRPAGPLLGMLPPAELAPGAGAPPSLNADVPRMLLREFHHRMNRAKGRRTHELEALLRRKDLPVGHGRSPDGLPGRAAVLLELRKLRLWNMQVKVRSLLEREEEEIVNMPDRLYKDFAKRAVKYKQQLDLVVQQKQHERWERLYIERMQYKKLATDRFVMYRDMHLMRNKQLGRLHERLARELNKQKMDDNDRRLEALKANDFEAYKELLRQTYGPLSDDDRFAEVERFLNETEEYINKLTKKLVQYKAEEQAGEAVQEAIAEARALELSEEEVKVRAAAAQQEHMATNELLTQVHTLGGDAQSRFSQLAHNIREKITRQPAYLKPPKSGKLREYQMVGLEWMVSLYNNKLNGILADEMGLGKTVQVMALLAYLYEFKQNYGPHLIIVPNAVIVNWKAELHTWLPDFRCVYYTGSKDERALKFQNEVQSMQFNILVTTYETIMRDRSKLSKLEWKYIIIDEAQRMKDRESKLSQDLNKFTTARRLLLTGTPLQNELKELWSLLNLLLPDVFNDSNTFSEWFTKFLGVDSFGDNGAAGGAVSEAAALDREKKILVVNRLHQILSPFMLRRMVKDVEQQLPEKVTITVKCPMSAYQSAIYNWIKTTNTIRVDPAHRRAAHGQRAWEPLQNKVMELRKVCNHPRLCYPDSEHFWGHDVVRTCGKMFWLDRMLVKLHASGHRVLLFSTMTKMLDTVEFYLNWRQVDSPDGSGEKVYMQSRRIDGATSLEQREAAIQEFNRPGSDVFIFLLSIRAAGRGLNLQTSDTVIIYDPDPNPKNEEQAIARSHRIGQTKEVRVFHLEAISDPADSFPPPVYQPRRGDAAPASGAAGAATAVMDGQQPDGNQSNGDDQQPSMFADSIESLMRNIIQKQKIDMANEVIDAGRFDMQTTNEERRKTLEEMLLDEDRLQTATNEAPTLESFNRQLARSSAEFDLFQRLDREAWWPGELFNPQEVPDYLCFTGNEAQEVLQITDRRPARIGVLATAERKAQGLTGQPEPSGRGRGRGHKPPKPSRLGPAPGAAGAQQQQQPGVHAVLSVSDLAGPSGGMRPSQSVGSFLGGTSLASGLGDEGEGEEEVVGGTASGMYEDIEEEVVDDRNIDEEFEKVLEQAEDVPVGAAMSAAAAPAAAASGGGGSAGMAGSAGMPRPGSGASIGGSAGAAGTQQQQPQQQQPLQYHVTFEDEQQQPAEAGTAAGTGAAAPTAVAAVAPAGGEDDEWEDVDKQPVDGVVTNGIGDGMAAASGAGAATKRSWGQLDASVASGGHLDGDYSGMGGGYSSGAVWPGMSGGGQATSSGMPSSSQGGAKKIKLSLKTPVPSQPTPQEQ